MTLLARPTNLRGLVLALLLAFPLLALGALQAMAQTAPASGSPHPMFLEDTSPANLPRTVEVFMEEVRAGGWSHLTTHNMAGILSTRGFTLDPVLIIEVCSGRHSAALLANDETRFVASMIPCRVAIYQTSDDRVIISRMNAPMMAEMMPPAVAEVIAASGAEMEAIIQNTLARLK